MVHPKVLVLRTAGTNCDAETVFAFEQAGAKAERVHINRLVSGEEHLSDYQILAIPGGFSYGDDIISGRILANELRLRLGDQLKRFIDDGKLMIGICNGFQVMVRAGILPGASLRVSPLQDSAVLASAAGGKKLPFRAPAVESADNAPDFVQTVTLTHNDSGKFEDRWIYLKPSGSSVWTQGIGQVLFLPVAHAEGKFVPRDEGLYQQLKDQGQIIFRYCSPTGGHAHGMENPNGSFDDIAGIADRTGRVLGLMPHPERHFLFTQHPSWTRMKKRGKLGDGAQIFINGVNYVKKNLI